MPCRISLLRRCVWLIGSFSQHRHLHDGRHRPYLQRPCTKSRRESAWCDPSDANLKNSMLPFAGSNASLLYVDAFTAVVCCTLCKVILDIPLIHIRLQFAGNRTVKSTSSLHRVIYGTSTCKRVLCVTDMAIYL